MAVTTRWAASGGDRDSIGSELRRQDHLDWIGDSLRGKSLKLLVTITSTPPTQCSRHHVFVFVVGQPERAVQAFAVRHDGVIKRRIQLIHERCDRCSARTRSWPRPTNFRSRDNAFHRGSQWTTTADTTPRPRVKAESRAADWVFDLLSSQAIDRTDTRDPQAAKWPPSRSPRRSRGARECDTPDDVNTVAASTSACIIPTKCATNSGSCRSS